MINQILTTLLVLLLSLPSFAQLSGNYTVGGSSPDFTTIDSAVTALENAGVSGPVTLYVRSGSYNESVTVEQIPGVSATNWVTLLGDTSSTRPNWTDVGIALIFKDANYIKVKNFEIIASGLSAILFTGSNSNISVDSNNLIGRISSALNYNESVIYRPTSATDVNTNISLVNNEIMQGGAGICWLNSSKTESGNRFENNSIEDYYGIGLLVGNQDNVSIKGNRIKTQNPRAGSSGIGLADLINGFVEQNKIHIMNGGTGIILQQARSTGIIRTAIRNNFISLGNGFNSYGIYVVRSNSFDIVHNSINSYGTTNPSYCYRQYQGKSILFQNNNAVNNGIGLAIVVDNLADYNGDYNNLVVSGSSQFGMLASANVNSFSDWKTSTMMDLNSISLNPAFVDSADLHLTDNSLKRKGNSLGLIYDIDNERRNKTTPDIGADEFVEFHNDGGILNNNSKACLGKYPVFATMINQGKINVSTANLYWELSINGGAYVPQSTVPWFGTLTPNSVTPVFLDSIQISKQTNYDIRVHLIDVNGILDSNNTNDTAAFQVLVNVIPGLGFSTVSDFCLNDSLYTFTQGSPTGGKYSGSGVSSDSIFNSLVAGLGAHKITYTVVDSNACSDTTSTLVLVNDTPSNNLGVDTALCSTASLVLSAKSIGNYLWNTGADSSHISVNSKGQYWLEITNQFGCKSRDTINVTFDAVCVGINQTLSSHAAIKYYPNPSTGIVTLNLNSNFEGQVELIIRNAKGQVVSQLAWAKTGLDLYENIDLLNQPSGIYFLELITPLGNAQHRITINR